MTTPFDYDADPERFRLATRVTRRHLLAPSLYELLAEALARLDPRRILDMGCGEGALRAALPARLASRTVGLDAAATMLAAHPPPVVQADATALPFADGVFGVAVAVNVLDHLPEPTVAIAEAHRVLAAGGALVAATASRHDSPELAAVWRPPPSSFDAEDGSGLVASVFGQVAVERWDAPLVRLPDRDAVRDYLIARFVAPEEAASAAERVAAPVAVTKRGALIHARKGPPTLNRSPAPRAATGPGQEPRSGSGPAGPSGPGPIDVAAVVEQPTGQHPDQPRALHVAPLVAEAGADAAGADDQPTRPPRPSARPWTRTR